MTDKITDNQLKQEIEDGKTYREISREYGYGFPSRHLREKIKSLGFDIVNNVSRDKWGGAHFNVKGGKVDAAEELKGFDFGDSVHYSVSVTDDGDFLVEVHENQIVEER